MICHVSFDICAVSRIVCYGALGVVHARVHIKCNLTNDSHAALVEEVIMCWDAVEVNSADDFAAAKERVAGCELDMFAAFSLLCMPILNGRGG